ncbi:hypothetical protein [Streptomyces sp. NPDC018031]
MTAGGWVVRRHPRNRVEAPPDPGVPLYPEFTGWFHQRKATASVA